MPRLLQGSGEKGLREGANSEKGQGLRKLPKCIIFAKEFRSEQRLRRPLYSGRRNSVRSETLFSTMRLFAASCAPSGEHVCHVGVPGQEGEGVWNLACHKRSLHAGVRGDRVGRYIGQIAKTLFWWANEAVWLYNETVLTRF